MPTNVLPQLLSHYAELYGFVAAIVRDRQDAEDVVQDVVAAILEQAQRRDLEIPDFPKWARQVARNRVAEHYRRLAVTRKHVLPVQEMVELVGDVFEQAESTCPEQLKAMRACMQKAPEQSRRLLQLRFIQGDSFGAIAAAVKMTEQAARRAISRARVALQACVQRQLQQQERA